MSDDDDFEELSALREDPRYVQARIARDVKHTRSDVAQLKREVFEGPESIRVVLGRHHERIGAVERRIERKPSPYPQAVKDSAGHTMVQVERWKALSAIAVAIVVAIAGPLVVWLTR